MNSKVKLLLLFFVLLIFIFPRVYAYDDSDCGYGEDCCDAGCGCSGGEVCKSGCMCGEAECPPLSNCPDKFCRVGSVQCLWAYPSCDAHACGWRETSKECPCPSTTTTTTAPTTTTTDDTTTTTDTTSTVPTTSSTTTTTTCPPAPSINLFEINDDDTYAPSKDVTLKTSATGVDKCRFKNQADSSWSSWISSYSPRDWTSDSGDGTKTVEVQCKEEPCDQKDSASDSIILDTTPPEISIFHSPMPVNQTVEPRINLTSSDALSGVNETRIYVNGTLRESCDSKNCSAQIGPYSVGTYVEYYGEAEDNMGNVNQTEVKNFTVRCEGPKCVSMEINEREFFLKPTEGDTFVIELNSTSIDNELIELYVENWDGKYGFNDLTCTHCGCSKCGYTGSSPNEDNNITLEVPNISKPGEVASVELDFGVKAHKSPGRYEISIKGKGV